ncbi:hypothetical protein HNO88_001552 [Novosphingobium chloroacetimidivorans]|uniref:DUF429 domain-containing protein n=1 Tax=Novosphingobium chloroacetimidivorans TaxID=1428314 RepID=A0A7W7NV58_9SPHN|nr:hypothetical protein [Novosphingobium chloroacetimidivorans]MBB4858233.1 hypothetical protein [Novosphingobium chloroacetimidivorans]
MSIASPRFSHFLAIDWSGAAGERQAGIALSLCTAAGDAPRLLTPRDHRHWSRAAVVEYLCDDLPPDTLVGMDLGISLPFADADAFFPGWPASPLDAHALWRLVDETCADDPHLAANSFVDHPQLSPYFRRHGGREGAAFHLAEAAHRRGRFRVTEAAQERSGCKPYSNFNLVGAAQVGKSSLTGMRVLHRLAGRVFVWPVDGRDLPPNGSVIVEIYTTIAALAASRTAARSKIRDGEALDAALALLGSPPTGLSGAIDDHSTDALLTSAWLRRHADDHALWHPRELTEQIARTEGWTFGAA